MTDAPQAPKPGFNDVRWASLLGQIEGSLIRIETPGGQGTGFITPSPIPGRLALATARHVIEDALQWQQPLRLTHYKSGKSHLFPHNERIVIPVENADAALIGVRNSGDFPEQKPPGLFNLEGKRLREGMQVGWCGFPGSLRWLTKDLCFFSGHVSAYLAHRFSYLVDGTIPHGCSGGPVFWGKESGEVEVIGVATAYIADIGYRGETYPGLGEVVEIRNYNDLLGKIRSFLEELANNESVEPPPPPPPQLPPAAKAPEEETGN